MVEEEPRRISRGLDCQTLPTLSTTSLENLTTASGAHAAQKAVNLLILPVVRLKRTLQRVHPLIRQGKHTRDYNPGATGRQGRRLLPWSLLCSLAAGITFSTWLVRLGDSHPRPVPRGFRAGFARLSSNMGVHKRINMPSPISTAVRTNTHRISPTGRMLSRLRRTFSPNPGTIVSTLHRSC